MRYRWLDYLRGIAALWMIEVHVVDVALDPTWHSAWWFPWLSLTHGFVAVAFLFCAGGALAITLERKTDAYRRMEPALWRYLAKLGLLLVIGYWLHLPAFSLERTLRATHEELLRLADCDILQTIAYSSLLALMLAMSIPRRIIRDAVLIAITVAFAALTPLVWEHRLEVELPIFLGALIAPQPVSKFPLFPFAAYFFAGVWLVPLLRSRSPRVLQSVAIACGLGAITLLAVGFSSPKEWWHSSPAHVAFRLSAVVSLLALLIRFEQRLSRIRFSNILLLAGQQSLWVYVFHLLLVYGSVGGKGLQTVLSHALTPAAVALLIGAIAAVTLATAWGWAYLKQHMPQLVRTVVVSVVVIGGLTFLLLPARYAELLAMGGLARLDGVAPVAAQNDLPR
ncbi:MAG: hypothetical protein KatS3mg039_1247 [Candidatus Kapaibacterium sp.]|nr:MAG: hypothetical protein KatS3mg039_1247 [Candidatus Kapabacteria bacterium]